MPIGSRAAIRLSVLRVIQDEREFRVQRFKHFKPVFPVQRQQNFAVRIAAKRIFRLQAFADGTKAVQLAVAHDIASVHFKWLHTRVAQSHDGQPMKPQRAAGHIQHARAVRPARGCAREGLHKLFSGNRFSFNADDGTHEKSTSDILCAASILISGRRPRLVVPPDLLLCEFLQTPAAVTCRRPAAPTCLRVRFGLGRVRSPGSPTGFTPFARSLCARRPGYFSSSSL